ncbi:unnamed protein product [Onchocerca flexuosa]|uniref:DDE Tnp4 domain-containing protein n=1 Tax=Onchocerca flexuosa TaxID=387005 RepID=A0A183HAJ3_9BILA|nr:unnamed protein product [Onchocerca flexuosa]
MRVTLHQNFKTISWSQTREAFSPSSYADSPRHMHEYSRCNCVCSSLWASRSVRCWMYLVKWQKGLPHAYILIWLYDKIISNEIDDVICAEIPDADVDKDLYEVKTKNMIHGPCGILNPNSLCMIDGKYSKR